MMRKIITFFNFQYFDLKFCPDTLKMLYFEEKNSMTVRVSKKVYLF